MSCRQVNLNCENRYNVESGSFYTFNVNLQRSLAGRTIHFDIKSTETSKFLFQLVDTGDPTVTGLNVLDETQGIFDVNITSADSAEKSSLEVFECYYLEGAEKFLLFQGRIEFYKGVI